MLKNITRIEIEDMSAHFQLNISLCCIPLFKRTYLRSILNDSILFYCIHFC